MVSDRRPGRETRLLLIILAVSAAALLVLAQFRFPEEPRIPVPPPTPLERLAARATYDELASILGAVERRLAPAIVSLRIEGDPVAYPAARPAARPPFAPALRIRPDAALAHLGPGERVAAIVGSDAAPVIIARDPDRRLAVVRVPPFGDAPADVWQAAPSDHGRYVAVVEATGDGLAARPGFLGPTWARRHVLWSAALLVPPAGLGLTPGALVFSLDARLVGLAVMTEDGAIALAPAAPLLAVARELEQGAPPASGDLGVEVGLLTPDLAAATGAASGVVVVSVRRDGPAGESLMFGDVIEAINGRRVESPYEFNVLVRRTAPAAAALLSIVRRGERRDVSLTAGEVPERDAERAVGLGITMRTRAGAGIEVVRLAPGSAGERAGLRPGDLITQLDDRTRPAPAELTRRYAQAKPGERLLLGVARDLAHLAVVLEKR